MSAPVPDEYEYENSSCEMHGCFNVLPQAPIWDASDASWRLPDRVDLLI